jgi:NADH dehydrogenase
VLGVPLDKRGRVIVSPQLNLQEYNNIFVLGDQACFTGTDGKDLPGLAPVALQQGDHAGKNILNFISGKPLKDFHYFDKGQMATIGRKRAIAEFAGIKIAGFFAYVAWVIIHIYFLIGFKNKFFVLLQWAWSYSFYRRGARLIVNKEWKSTSNNQSLKL